MSRVGNSVFTIMMPLGMTLVFAPGATPKIRHVEPGGREIYLARCAGCHGQDGKGNAGAVAELKPAQTDLTALNKRNGGTFPAGRFRGILVGLVDIPAHHGCNPMPIWGDVFDARTSAARQRARERLATLTTYLKSIQRH
jgi:mono/diheme cytochrome c family protein